MIDRAEDQRKGLHAAMLIESARQSQALPAGTQSEQSVQQAIQKELMTAQTALSKVYQLAVGKNPMAADLPVFQRVKEIQKDCTHLMMGIAKVRGL